MAYGNIGLRGKFKIPDGGTAGASGSLTELDNPVMFSLPDAEAEVVEIPNLAMVNGFVPSLAGVLKGGKFSCEMIYSDKNWSRLNAIKNVNKTVAVVIPKDGTTSSVDKTYTFDLILQKLDMQVESEKPMILKMEGKINSLVTIS